MYVEIPVPHMILMVNTEESRILFAGYRHALHVCGLPVSEHVPQGPHCPYSYINNSLKLSLG